MDRCCKIIEQVVTTFDNRKLDYQREEIYICLKELLGVMKNRECLSAARRTDILIIEYRERKTKDRYKKITEKSYSDLPRDAKTALFDYAFQVGEGGVPNDLMIMLSEGNYSDATQLLKEIAAKTTSRSDIKRRNDEALLLSKLQNLGVVQ
jgi:GH24 family phage-related lysozyme (muramidase)